MKSPRRAGRGGGGAAGWGGGVGVGTGGRGPEVAYVVNFSGGVESSVEDYGARSARGMTNDQ